MQIWSEDREFCWGPDRRRSGPQHPDTFVSNFNTLSPVRVGSRFSDDKNPFDFEYVRSRIEHGPARVRGPGQLSLRFQTSATSSTAGTSAMPSSASSSIFRPKAFQQPNSENGSRRGSSALASIAAVTKPPALGCSMAAFLLFTTVARGIESGSANVCLWHYPEGFEGANEFRSLRCCGPVLLAASSSLRDPGCVKTPRFNLRVEIPSRFLSI
jgi:hypothetical protein